MSIIIGIMAHPKRKNNVDVLLQQLSNAFHIEDNNEGCWPTSKKCWIKGFQSNCDHILVLQDDIILCPSFLENLDKVISARPNDVISLFTPYNNFILDKNIRWLKMKKFGYTQGLILPKEILKKFLEWCDRFVLDSLHPWSDDGKFDVFFRDNKIPIFVTLPNLVEHEDKDSLLGNKCWIKRKSVWWKQDDSNYDWKDLKYIEIDEPHII